jgi:Cu+-exporting ATPase
MLTRRTDGEEGATMTDPVCGMQVDERTAVAAWDYDGTTYLFCSAGCMRRFREDPEHYLSLSDDERHM